MTSALVPAVEAGEVHRVARLIAKPNPFRPERIDRLVDEGTPLAQVVAELEAETGKTGWRVRAGDGGFLSPEEIAQRAVRAGEPIYAVSVPAFGLSWLAIAAIISVVTTLVSIVISVLSAFGVFTSKPGKNKSDSLDAGRQATIEGTRNEARLDEPVMQLYGRTRVYPDLAAQPITETIGGQQYLRMLFTAGPGPILVEQPKIGETDLGVFAGVQYQVHEDYQGEAFGVYWALATEEAVGEEYQGRFGAIKDAQRTTALDARGFGVELAFGNGIGGISKQGQRFNFQLRVELFYRLTGSGNPWTLIFDTAITGESQTTILWGAVFNFPAPGQYDVLVRRQDTAPASQFTAERGGSAQIAASWSDFRWTSLTSYKAGDPVLLHGHTLIELRIRANDQLNGVVDRLNFIGTRKLRTWDGTAWTAPVATRAAAWAYVDQLTNPKVNKRPVVDARLDLVRLKAWADASHNFDMVWRDRAPVLQRLVAIARAGEGSFHQRDSLFSVLRDEPQAVPVQVFTPRNSWGFRGSKAFRRTPPHALRVKFINELNGWTEDERVVYDDGYSETGSDPGTVAATLFEGWELPGVTHPDEIWRRTRKELKRRRLRPETFEFNADFEHLVAERGDLVLASHDVPGWGDNWSRIREVELDANGRATWLLLDAFMVYEPGVDYSACVRSPDSEPILAAVVNPATSSLVVSREIVFGSPVVAAAQPQEEDLVVLGPIGQETAPLLIEMIESIDDEFAAKITAVDYAPGVYADAATPAPPYDPHITSNVQLIHRVPPVPTIVTAKAQVVGTTPEGTPLVKITLTLKAGSGTVLTKSFNAQVRVPSIAVGGGVAEWQSSAPVPASQPYVEFGPIQSAGSFDARAQAVSPDGAVSDWVTLTNQQLVGAAVAPTNVRVLEQVIVGAGGARVVLRLSWDPTPGGALGYQVRYRRGAAEWTTLRPTLATADIEDAQKGSYEIGVSAVGLDSQSSAETLVFYEYVPDLTGGLARPTGFEIAGRGHSLDWIGRDVTLRWNRPALHRAAELGDDPSDTPGVEPLFAGYEIRVVDPDTDAVVRLVQGLRAEEWTYGYEMNAQDGPLGTDGVRRARRELRVELRVLDTVGHVSPPATLRIRNEAPAQPASVRLRAALRSIFVEVTGGDDPLDGGNFIVWASRTAGFVPSDSTRVAESATAFLSFDADSNTHYFVRAARADAFSKDPALLNLSQEYDIALGGIGFDVVDSGVVESVAAGWVKLAGKTYTVDEHVGRRVRIVAAASGEATTRLIASNDADGTLYIDGSWRLGSEPLPGDAAEIRTTDIEDGAVDALSIGTLTVEFINLVNDAASGLVQFVDPAPRTIFDGSDAGTWRDVGSISIVSPGNFLPVHVSGQGFYRIDSIYPASGIAFGGNYGLPQFPGGAGPLIEFRLIRDGDGSSPVWESDPVTISGAGYVPGAFVGEHDLPPAGPHTYTFQCRWSRARYLAGTAGVLPDYTIQGYGSFWQSFVRPYEWAFRIPAWTTAWAQVSEVSAHNFLRLTDPTAYTGFSLGAALYELEDQTAQVLMTQTRIKMSAIGKWR